MLNKGSNEAEQRYHSDTEFTKEEKQVLDIIIKSNFRDCKFDKYYSYINIHEFYYNNLKLIYRFDEDYDLKRESNKFIIERVDNGHILREIKMGASKLKIVNDIITDKRNAYIEDSITSAFRNKSANKGDCPYCSTKNPKDKTNCVNCGAVLTYKG